MGPNDEKTPVILNLGCGFAKMQKPVINVDKFEICNPDVVHDLEQFPYPWEDNSVDQIFAFHIMEHLHDWWTAFCECARILRVGGFMDMRVPHESSTSAGTYRDHHNIISIYSFCGADGTIENRHNTNAWAATMVDTVPMHLQKIIDVPHPQYNWMQYIPNLLRFCINHMRNFAWETRYIWRKTEITQKHKLPVERYLHLGEASRK